MQTIITKYNNKLQIVFEKHAKVFNIKLFYYDFYFYNRHNLK